MTTIIKLFLGLTKELLFSISEHFQRKQIETTNDNSHSYTLFDRVYLEYPVLSTQYIIDYRLNKYKLLKSKANISQSIIVI